MTENTLSLQTRNLAKGPCLPMGEVNNLRFLRHPNSPKGEGGRASAPLGAVLDAELLEEGKVPVEGRAGQGALLGRDLWCSGWVSVF